jgi:hypothetical protein
MPMSAALDGWHSSERRCADGSVEIEERALATNPVVDVSRDGGRLLGSTYWLEVRRATRGLVRVRTTTIGVELQLLGTGPPLLRLGPAEVAVEGDRVSCRYPIRGGWLSGRAGGSLTLSQEGRDLSVAVNGFYGRRIYERVQRRVHVAISRRYFRRLLARRPA